MTQETTFSSPVERMYFEWERALSNNDPDALLACYASDATLESPVVTHLNGSDGGVLQGHEQLWPLFKQVAERKPTVRKYYRSGYLTDGRKLMFEYPRLTPDGEQMDFVEVMELNDEGLIQRHRVYWGWFGLRVQQQDAYHKNG